MDQQKAIVVFSGGQDSTTCLFWAKERFAEVEAVTFDYGQKHRLEIEWLRRLQESLALSTTFLTCRS